MVDTKIKLAQCPRCRSFVYLCDVGGVRTAADLEPVSRQQALDALLTNRRLLRIRYVSGRPTWLQDARKAHLKDLSSVVVAHGCGCAAISMAVVRAPEAVSTPPACTEAGVGVPGPQTGAESVLDPILGLSGDRCNGRACNRCAPVPF